MSDFFGDFPDRPQVPEFWALSETVLRNDGAAEEEGAEGFLRICDEIAPTEVIAYMAMQRTLRIVQVQAASLLLSPETMAMISALWMDGFLAGGHYVNRHPKSK